MNDDLTWFTTSISGQAQAIHIRPWKSRNPDDVRFLNERETQFLNAVLNEIACDSTIDEYSKVSKAVLRAFYKLGAPPTA